MTSTVIHAESLGKNYRRGLQTFPGLRHALENFLRAPLQSLRRPKQETFWALKDVSLDVREGEVLGLIGRNGAGKTTLLKILSRITRPTTGFAEIRGRVGSLLEVGTGFHPELTGRENAFLSGAILGMSKCDITRKFDEIVAFAELEKFIDTPVKHYSSGMYVRLAFATAVQVDADILLVDEVLAVGDANFQQKCFDEFTRLQQAGRTMLFVTHDMGAVERFCNRAMLLERGRVVDIGEPESIARQYNQHNFRLERQTTGDSSSVSGASAPALVAEVVNAWFETVPGEIAVTAHQGQPCSVRMDVHFFSAVENPIFAITLLNETGHPVFATSSDAQRIVTGSFGPGASANIRMQFENWLAPGRYRLTASVARAGFGADVFDAHVSNSIIVLADRPGGGVTDLPHTLEIERA